MNNVPKLHLKILYITLCSPSMKLCHWKMKQKLSKMAIKIVWPNDGISQYFADWYFVAALTDLSACPVEMQSSS